MLAADGLLGALDLALLEADPVVRDDELRQALELGRLLLKVEKRALLLAQLVQLRRDLLAQQLSQAGQWLK